MRGFQTARASDALDKLHHASTHLAAEFDMNWPREMARANLEARAILLRRCNAILESNGVPPITQAEVDAERGMNLSVRAEG